MAKTQPNPVGKTAVRGSSAGVRAGLPPTNALKGSIVGKQVGLPPRNVGRTVAKGTPGPKKK